MASLVPQMQNMALNTSNVYYFDNSNDSNHFVFTPATGQLTYTMPSSSGTLALVGATSSVAASEVTQGTGDASFGTSDAVRLYSLNQGICIDVASGFDTVIKEAGTSVVSLNTSTMLLYPDNYTISHTGTGSLTISGTSTIVIGSGDGIIDISTGNGTSSIILQSYKEIYQVDTSTNALTQATLWSSPNLVVGVSTSLLVSGEISAVAGLSGWAAGYKISNIFYDNNDGNGPSTIIDGITYAGTKSHYGAASGKIGTANNMLLNSDGSGTIRILMTPETGELTYWKGIVEVVLSYAT